ncbi:MAG: DUF3362 domain-containing protein, partial [Lachnospiraceae bacterium]|nr:DUF3362 domain-containing protein [Lachnospiraceae bacterium]
YLISSHPGSDLKDAIALAESIRDMGYLPEQVQDFYPTPSTVSTCMYYTGLDPRNMKEVSVTRNPHEKAMQRALLQYRRPENYELVKEALIRENRTDLMGFDKDHCLIPPRKMSETYYKSIHAIKEEKKKKEEKSGAVKNPKNRQKKETDRKAESRNRQGTDRSRSVRKGGRS